MGGGRPPFIVVPIRGILIVVPIRAFPWFLLLPYSLFNPLPCTPLHSPAPHQMYPGEEGKLRFLTEVRRLLGLSETTVINVNFECAAPPAIASAASMPSGGGGGGGVDELCGQVSQLSLKGLGTWDAAVFCATMAASQKAVAAADVTAGGRDAGQQLQRQQQQQQQSQSQQQQLQSVDALAAVDPELLYWTRLGPQPMPSPSRQQSQRAATGDLLSHHLSGPRLLLSPRQTIPTAAMSAGGEEPVGPTSASASASNALLSASIVAATSPQPFSGSGGLHSAPYAAAAAVTPSHPPQGALSPRAQAARPPQRTAAAVAAVEGHSVSVAVAGVGDRLLASSAALPRHALAGSLLRQVQQVWMDILPRCH